MTTLDPAADYAVRWYADGNDRVAVLALGLAAAEPFGAEDLDRLLEQKDVTRLVAAHGSRFGPVTGFAAYRFGPAVEVLRLEVPYHWDQWAARALVRKVRARADGGYRPAVFDVDERRTPLLVLLKEEGFRATRVVPCHGGPDKYRMVYGKEVVDVTED